MPITILGQNPADKEITQGVVEKTKDFVVLLGGTKDAAISDKSTEGLEQLDNYNNKTKKPAVTPEAPISKTQTP